jgi:hypothetical protein
VAIEDPDQDFTPYGAAQPKGCGPAAMPSAGRAIPVVVPDYFIGAPVLTVVDDGGSTTAPGFQIFDA